MASEKDDLTLKVLRWFCPAQLLEEIEGDLLQKFKKEEKIFGQRIARRKLLWNQVRFFRPEILLRNKIHYVPNQISMLQNYLRISFRQMMRNKVFSMINIGGLAIGMAAFMMIMHYVRFERSYENFHVNGDNIFRVTLDIYKGSEFVTADTEMYAPVGPMLKQKFPEVLEFVRLYDAGNREVKNKGKAFYEDRVFLADPSVFDIFSFQVLAGDARTALREPFQVVITRSEAEKYFGTWQVLGHTIEISKFPFRITGVIDDSPLNTHLKVNFLVSHATIAKLWEYDETKFSGNNEYLYTLMSTGTNISEFNEKLKKFSEDLVGSIGDDRLVAETMNGIHLYSNKAYDPEPTGGATIVYFLLAVAILTIVVAWINYINLTTAKAMERAHEVGVRKIMGSLRMQLVFQFLTESFMVATMGGCICVALIYLSYPLLSSLPVMTPIFVDPTFWYQMIVMLVLGSIVAGCYPALLLSSFQPVRVLKGKLISAGSGQWLRRGLVIFQFLTSIVLLVCVSVVYFQILHMKEKDLGMNIDRLLVVRTPLLSEDSLYHKKFESFKTEATKIPGVQQVAISGSVPGTGLLELSTTGNIFRWGEDTRNKGFIYYIQNFDENFIPVFGMELLAGRNFEGWPASEHDLLLNEEAVRILGFKSASDAVGSKVSFYNNENTVIGVLKNFYQRSPKEPHLPMVFWYNNESDFFTLQLNGGNTQESVEMAQDTWNQVFSGSPFEYFFADERFNHQYKTDILFGQVIGAFAALAVFIACLGLFGLSLFNALRRTKEIGIRKVLGASVVHVIRLLSAEFVMLIVMAGLLAMPVAYLVAEGWLSQFATRIQVSVPMLIAPILLVLVVCALTVSIQTLRAAKRNPVDAIRYE